MFSPSTSRAAATIPPPPEHGVNVWTLAGARRCAMAGLTQAEARAAIEAASSGRLRAGRVLSPQEIERAITTAYGTPCLAGDTKPRAASLPPAEIARLCPPVTKAEAEAFVASSPMGWRLSSAEILGALYNADQLIGLKACNEWRAERWRVRQLGRFFELASRPVQFVTSSPISGRLGTTQDGKPSYTAKECFSEQRHVVVEFDGVEPSAQMARILFLRRLAEKHAPLVMVLESGRASLHSWFRPLSPEATEALKKAAVKLGADPAAMRVHQPVRCPAQTRDNGNLQRLLWFSPIPSR